MAYFFINMYSKAITRKPCKNFAKGLTTADLGQANYEVMIKQHRKYTTILKSLGLDIIELEPLDNFPDAHFVEDTAVITPEVAVITRPGAESRKGEEVSIENELMNHKTIKRIKQPGTLDGGDVLIIGKNVFVGISKRTNPEGANQLSDILDQYNYESAMVMIEAGLHLKSDVNYIGKNTLIVTEKYIDHPLFRNYNKICVEAKEAYAANSLLINDKVLIPQGFSKTREKLEIAGFDLIKLEMRESQKMDGGLTCLSLRF